ncbi:MAG: DbpA RNA binding domain-containing protein [Polyangiaceae bacterium]
MDVSAAAGEVAIEVAGDAGGASGAGGGPAAVAVSPVLPTDTLPLPAARPGRAPATDTLPLPVTPAPAPAEASQAAQASEAPEQASEAPAQASEEPAQGARPRGGGAGGTGGGASSRFRSARRGWAPSGRARRAPGRWGGRRRDRDDRRRGPRGDFSEGARDRAASRPLDRARPVGEPGAKAFVRHADFTTWQPPEEEGDDEPIWGDQRRPGASPDEAHGGPGEAPGAVMGGDIPRTPVDAVELHVTVGRRDGARASDLVRVLEKAGLAKDSVQRVRVRERHAFLTVRREDEERAIAALHGAVIAGRMASAERARERAPAAPTDAPAEPSGGGEDPSA